MKTLTPFTSTTMIYPLSVGKLSGVRSPFIRGAKTPAKGVFLCSSFLHSATCAYSLWRRYLGYLRVGRSTGGTSNPLNAAAQSFEVFTRRLFPLYRGVTAMNTQSTGHQSAQNPTKTALFNIFWHRKAICQNITGTLAMRFKRRYPACVVKFVGMEVQS